MQTHLSLPLTLAALACGVTAMPQLAEAQERVYVYSYGYRAGPVYGFGPVYGYRAPIADEPFDEYRPTGHSNRALGTYVPRSGDDLPESRRFFRGITRQSGGE